jgi:hypothetical protein
LLASSTLLPTLSLTLIVDLNPSIAKFSCLFRLLPVKIATEIAHVCHVEKPHSFLFSETKPNLTVLTPQKRKSAEKTAKKDIFKQKTMDLSRVSSA